MQQENAQKVGVIAKLHKFFGATDLTKGCIWKTILKFTIPIIISYLLQQFYILTDAIICGQTLSADEVAGVNDTSPLIFIFMQFAFGCTAGFCVYTSKKAGANDGEGLKKSFATQIILCSVITVVLTVLAVFLIKPLLAIVNVTPKNKAVYKAAYTYCFVIFLGIISQVFYNFIISILRSIGDSVTPLFFLIGSTALNIGLDLLFIKVLHWGVAGAAVATVITQLLCTVCCFVYSFVRYKQLRLKKHHFKLALVEVWEHLKLGLPLGLQFSVLAIGLIVMQAETVRFDILPNGLMVENNPAQNGTAAANQLIRFTMAPFNALGTAMVSFNAQNLGAKDYERVKKGTNQGLFILLITCIVCMSIGLLLTINGTYQRIFLSADKISVKSLKLGTTFLYIDIGLYIGLGGLIVLRSCVQGIGLSNWTLVAGVGELLARVLVCKFLPPLVNGGATDAYASLGAYIALSFGDPIAWFIALFILLYPYYKHIVKKDYNYLLKNK